MVGNDNGFRCGFVAIVGAPNSGKSTLLNRLLDLKVAATTSRPQTTRTRILGIWTEPAAQIVFVDTPGLHHPASSLQRVMVQTAISVLGEVDILIWLVGAARSEPAEEKIVLDHLSAVKKPVVLALNKIDLIKPPALLPLIDRLAACRQFHAVVPISALRGEGLDVLTAELIALLPQGGPVFPADQITDQPERVLAAEFVREKAMRLTGQEVPYGVAVAVSEFTEKKERNLVYIRAVISVERESHKAIIIGAKGAKLKQIGQAARREIERLLGVKVYLDLFVRVEKNWTRKEKLVRRMGY